MKTKNSNLMLKALFVGGLLSLTTACKVEDEDLLGEANNPTTAEVFIDGFSSTLDYHPYANAVATAFEVDNEVTHNNSAASMRFDIPNSGYFGGAFQTSVPRNLSGYNVLTFWAKATEANSITSISLGENWAGDTYKTTLSNLQLSTTWKKYYIPIPDASKLTSETGMISLAASPVNSKGWTFWLDDAKFENLGTISQAQPMILNGANQVFNDTYIGFTTKISSGFSETFSLPDGTTESVDLPISYYTFESSNTDVATVATDGTITVKGAGTAVITAKVNGVTAKGSLTINSKGAFVHAPAPTYDASSVISIFSDKYTNISGVNTNPYWGGQGTKSADFVVDGDHVLNYYDFKYVGTTMPLVDASAMTSAHLDIYVPTGSSTSASLRVTIRDFGANGADDGGNVDDTNISKVIPSSQLIPGQWNSIEIPMRGKTRSNIGLILYDNGSNISNFWVDNIYFHDEAVKTTLLDFEDGVNMIPFQNGATSENITNPHNTTGNTSSKVLKFTKVVGCEWYSGVAYVTPPASPIVDLSKGAVFSVKIWSPKAGINVRLSIEDGNGTPPDAGDIKVLTKANEWVTLTYDLTSKVGSSTKFAKVVVFPDFDASNQVPVATEAVYYIDDIKQQ